MDTPKGFYQFLNNMQSFVDSYRSKVSSTISFSDEINGNGLVLKKVEFGSNVILLIGGIGKDRLNFTRYQYGQIGFVPLSKTFTDYCDKRHIEYK